MEKTALPPSGQEVGEGLWFTSSDQEGGWGAVVLELRSCLPSQFQVLEPTKCGSTI